jgi:WASH complex subunit 7
VLLTADHEHLKNFYMIVPALCISWTDASLQAKDNMFKATRVGAASREMYYTDDGFAVGTAYCLAILKQTKKYDALHWVDTVRHKLKADAKVLAKQQALRAEKEAKIKERRDKEERKKNSISAFFAGKSKAPKEEDEEADYEDLEEVHSLQVTGKRLEAQRRESDALYYSMSGAAIFFKRSDVDT